MARLASIAVAGYYPLPEALVPRVAAMFTVDTDSHLSFLDPCAGEGAAMLGIVKHVTGYTDSADRGDLQDRVRLYGIEMEAGRHMAFERKVQTLLGWGASKYIVRGDAFAACIEPGKNRGVGMLYLNPPYDTDRVHGRLEERFLVRFAPMVREGGWLVFVVPAHALPASAATLAAQFEAVECFRFPEADYEAYKQVVLVARKSGPKLESDATIAARVRAFAAAPMDLPVLPEADEPSRYDLPAGTSYVPDGALRPSLADGFDVFEMKALDYTELLRAYQPWSSDRGAGASVLPRPGEDLLTRTYPVAVPPRPAHIAAGIAAGVFNGNRIVPDAEGSKAPPLLVKGVFNREFRTVEEKENKDGVVTGVVQVQQPKLSVTVLDLTTSTYHTLKPAVEATGSAKVGEFSTGDLIAQYGSGLLGALRARCPVLHDPARPEMVIALPSLDQPLYPAQEHATMACVKVLGGLDAPMSARQGLCVPLLGEIGSGKTRVAFATALACGARRILVLCPPHLLDGWREQIAKVYAKARVMVLSDVRDVQAFEAATDKGIVIALLSREAAKLGHGWVSGVAAGPKATTGSVCPKCGHDAPAVDHAKKRLRCSAVAFTADNDMAALLCDYGALLLRAWPDRLPVAKLFPGAGAARVREVFTERVAGSTPAAKARRAAEVAKLAADPRFEAIVWRLVEALEARSYSHEETGARTALRFLLLARNDAALTRAVIERIIVASLFDPREYGAGSNLREYGRGLLLAFAPGSPEQTAAIEWVRDATAGLVGSARLDLTRLELKVRDLLGLYHATSAHNELWAYQDWQTKPGRAEEGAKDDAPAGALRFKGFAAGNAELYLKCFDAIGAVSAFAAGPECGGELFQAVAEPYRYPLATYIARKCPNSFDFLIVDEGHEYSTDGSAQERAAHRLTGVGRPTMLLTGSVMNGYAESLFANWWACFRSFRREFKRSERQPFVDRYGYRKRFVQDADKITGEVVEYGSMSDRVERREKDLGNAPGVLPLFILKHLLRDAVTIHKTDLQVSIPKFTEIPLTIPTDNDQGMRHSAFMQDLLRQIKKDRYTKLAGKLWGAMSEAPSQLDRATLDTGNAKDGSYEAHYPDKLEDKTVAGRVVARAEGFLSAKVLPKEQVMLDTIAAELAEGRNVMVFTWHVELMPRLAMLLKRITPKVPVLDPSKVPTKTRIAWIEKNVVQTGARVLLTNPVCVQTGINNLVHFASIWWHENPMCNPIVKRQAEGRIDRIGQNLETRSYFPRYEDAGQMGLYELLMHKVGVSMAVDGLDAESALQAAGVGEAGAVTGFSIGKELYNRITQEGW